MVVSSLGRYAFSQDLDEQIDKVDTLYMLVEKGEERLAEKWVSNLDKQYQVGWPGGGLLLNCSFLPCHLPPTTFHCHAYLAIS